MAIPVLAKNDLDAYILETTIVVKIPQGTSGFLVQEVRKDIVIVQFDVPSLGPLRVDRRDLQMNDSLDTIIDDMQRVLKTEPFVEKDAHKSADVLLVRAIEMLITDENKKQISQIVRLFSEIPKHYQ